MQDKKRNSISHFGVLDHESLEYALNRYNHVNRWVIADMLRRSAGRYPDKTALIFQDRELNYAQLEKECNRFANALLSLGLKRYDRVAVLAHNTLHHVLAWIGCCKAGLVYLPVNYLLGGLEIQYLVTHSESKALVLEDAFYDPIKKMIDGMQSLDTLIWSSQGLGSPPPGEQFLEFDSWYQAFPASEPDIILRIEEPCQMVYTSGTEADPKGVVINNQALLAGYVGCIADGGYHASDVNINALPVYNSIQRDVFMNPVFYIGGTNILLGPDIGEVLGAIEKYKATMLYATPVFWAGILSHAEIGRCDLSSLKKIYCGVSAMPEALLIELRTWFPDAELFNYYGQIELASYHAVLKGRNAWEKPGCIGRAGLNMEMRLFAGEGQEMQKASDQGEICGRGPHVMMMYFKDPEKTDEVMAGRWFHSGDSGMLDTDGRIMIVDRKRDLIRSDESVISSREIEEIIYRHEGVAEAAVIGVPHPDETEVPIAVVVPMKSRDIGKEEIVGLCMAHLNPCKVPREVVFVKNLPKTQSGKLLKRELRKAYKHIFGNVKS